MDQMTLPATRSVLCTRRRCSCQLEVCIIQWFGIALSEVGDYEGTKAKILNAYIIREHFMVLTWTMSLCVIKCICYIYREQLN